MDKEIDKIVYKRINITLPEDTLAKAKRIAETEDRPLSNVIKRCIDAYRERDIDDITSLDFDLRDRSKDKVK